MVQQHSQQAALSSLVQQAVLAHEAPQRHSLLSGGSGGSSDQFGSRSAPRRESIPPQLYRHTQVVSVNVSAQPSSYSGIKSEVRCLIQMTYEKAVTE